jgi:hypothetical protein
MLVIGGTGRCGTVFICRTLERLGVNAKHEPGDLRLKEKLEAIVSLRHGPKLHALWQFSSVRPPIVRVALQVRHPLPCIQSLHTITNYEWSYGAWMNRCFTDDWHSSLSRCMCVWLYWNAQWEAVAEYVYQVERAREAMPTLMQMLERDYNDDDWPKLNTATNSWKKLPEKRELYPEPLTWQRLHQEDPLLCWAIQNQAMRYGYEVPEDEQYERDKRALRPSQTGNVVRGCQCA